MATTDKLVSLAFAPSAMEGEAVAAFLALRRMGYSPNIVPSVNDKATATWNVKIPAKSFDAFFASIVEYKTEPFYTFSVNNFRDRLIDRWEIKLKVFFDTDAELERFTAFFERVFARL